MMEALIASGMLATVAILAIEMLALTAAARRAADRREVALQEAANVVERASAIPFGELSGERLGSVALSPNVAALLPEARLSLAVEPADDELQAHHVKVEISWTSAGASEPPVRLDFWSFAPKAAAAGGSP